MSKKPTITVPLEYPIEWEGREITELTFRRMINKDLLVAEKEPNQVRASWMLTAALCGMPVGFIELLDADDRDTIDEVTIDLMGKRAAAQARKAMAAQDAVLERMLNPQFGSVPGDIPAGQEPESSSPGETGS